MIVGEHFPGKRNRSRSPPRSGRSSRTTLSGNKIGVDRGPRADRRGHRRVPGGRGRPRSALAKPGSRKRLGRLTRAARTTARHERSAPDLFARGVPVETSWAGPGQVKPSEPSSPASRQSAASRLGRRGERPERKRHQSGRLAPDGPRKTAVDGHTIAHRGRAGKAPLGQVPPSGPRKNGRSSARNPPLVDRENEPAGRSVSSRKFEFSMPFGDTLEGERRRRDRSRRGNRP